MPDRALKAVTLSVSLLVLLSGCSSDGKSSTKGSSMTSQRITLAEGKAGLDQYKAEALAALPKGTTLRPNGTRTTSPCTINHPEGPVETGDAWFVHGPDPAHNDGYAKALLQHFSRLGWKPYQDGVQDGTWGRLSPDGYLLRVTNLSAKEAKESRLSIILSTPCTSH